MRTARARWLNRVMAVVPLAILIAPPEAPAQQHAADDPWGNLDEVRSYLYGAATEPGFNGVVLIGRGDDVVLERAYGFAEVEHRVPMRTDHRFRLGSLTKPITASAVLVAVDRGLLALDEKACRLLASCPRTWQDVTVRHLLTHSSGIPDHFGDLAAVPVEETVEELRRVLGSLSPDEPLRATPGTEYEHSNFNYVLLGALLKAVVGAPWEDVLRELVFEPLGLRSMAYDDVHAIMEDRVRGYERDDTQGLQNIDYDDHAAYAAGGLLSNTRDVFRWSRGMLNGELFSARFVRESLVPYRGDYGYGWQIRQFFDRDIYNHTGGIDGFSSHLAHYPDEGLTILVLTNVAEPPIRASGRRTHASTLTSLRHTFPVPQSRPSVSTTTRAISDLVVPKPPALPSLHAQEGLWISYPSPPLPAPRPGRRAGRWPGRRQGRSSRACNASPTLRRRQAASRLNKLE